MFCFQYIRRMATYAWIPSSNWSYQVRSWISIVWYQGTKKSISLPDVLLLTYSILPLKRKKKPLGMHLYAGLWWMIFGCHRFSCFFFASINGKTHIRHNLLLVLDLKTKVSSAKRWRPKMLTWRHATVGSTVVANKIINGRMRSHGMIGRAAWWRPRSSLQRPVLGRKLLVYFLFPAILPLPRVWPNYGVTIQISVPNLLVLGRCLLCTAILLLVLLCHPP